MIKRIVLAMAFVMMLTGIAVAEPVILKWGSFEPAVGWSIKDVWGPYIEKANKIAPDVLQFKLYPGGTLGKNPLTYFKLVEDGVMDIGWLMNPYKPGRFVDDVVFNFPYITTNVTEPTLAVNALHKRGLLRGYDNLYPVALVTTGQFNLATNFPVKSPADLKGKKIRGSSKIQFELIKALGATPVNVPITKAAESISRGVIQGCIAEPLALSVFRVADVAKYFTIIPLGCVPVQMSMSRKRYNALPAKARAFLDNHAGLRLALIWALQDDKTTSSIIEGWEKDPKSTVFIPNAEQRKEWDAMMKPVFDAWLKADPRNEKLYQAYMEELALYR
jgi:TRAP-type C4-dicarboxylate transport system substrate-binding protein